VREYVTGLFTLLGLLSLFILVAAAYQTYRQGLEYARMKDLACTLATQFCMGEKPGTLPENLPLEGTYGWGHENFKFRLWVLTGCETAPANLPPRAVEVEVPALAGGAPARLRVVVWR
jgi:hypothetical protein